ncbi:hypothetical protein EW146_g5445 [Bondarzewia mesenterica]|uniref:Uncharacterized protein n=1 Tax=Bondarzewia mesenterica TaxID=1095465 RepID=A0A4S4LX88_9AGAM|nr:hypothetical protein EW146_g5445 [Bondarzewia mesenterica]
MAKTTDSLRTYYESREVEEWLQSVAGVLDQGWNEQAAAARPPRQYEFATGFNTYFGSERFNVGELFFTHSQQLVASNPHLPRPLPGLIAQSLTACEQEIRQLLMANVVLCGGGSLLAGFVDRLANELSRQYPHVKIHAPGNPTERRYGGWLGGSILASLGTFHQLWISKEEWQVRAFLLSDSLTADTERSHLLAGTRQIHPCCNPPSSPDLISCGTVVQMAWRVRATPAVASSDLNKGMECKQHDNLRMIFSMEGKQCTPFS